ncbi:MAG: TIGR03792 family protein [Caldilineaceae bacterium]
MAVVELLRVHCAPNCRDEFLRRDAEVWTPALTQHDGFISKEVWVSLEDPTLVTFVIRWESLAQWKSFPICDLEALDAKLADIQTSLECEAYTCCDEWAAPSPAAPARLPR